MKGIILVFPCGSEIGLEIHNSLKWSTHFELIGASSVEDHGKFVYNNYIPNLPYINDPLIIPKLLEIVKEQNCSFIIPAHDSAVVLMAKHRKDFEKVGCKVITSDYKTCEICRSKNATYDHLEGIIPLPKRYTTPDTFPLFLKPDIGQGSKGTYLVHTKDELNYHLQRDSSLLIMEYLPGEEYTIDCFTNYKRELLFAGARIRGRTLNGISVNAKSIHDPMFNDIAEKINNTLSFRGMWFFQLKKDNQGTLKLLEVSPRVAGTMGLHRNMGVNLPLLSLFDAMDVDVTVQPTNLKMELDRCLTNRYITDLNYNTVYVDLDDSLILNDQVNPLLIAFIFQCINENKKLVLLTRHKGNLIKTLEKHRLRYLFDDVMHITNNEKKSERISGSDAIYIDDSHAERLEVATNACIPVFDTHGIECLINWKY